MVKVMRFLEKIMHILILNLLWISGALVGFIFFGLMPASYAVSLTIEKKSLFEPHSPVLPIVKYYIKIYKDNFIRMNGAMIIYALISLILLADLYIIQFNQYLNILLVPLVLLILYTFISISYFFPIFSVKEGTLFEKVRLLLTAPLINLKSSLKVSLYILIAFLTFYYILPIFILVFPSLYIKMSHLESKKALLENKMIYTNNDII